jgi:hypothetical protein
VSSRDFALYGAPLNRFAGRILKAGLATNSITLLFDEGDHRQRYVWIDPPWVLERGGAVVASGGDYPEPTEPEYQLKHEAWCAWVKALLDGAEFRSATASLGGTVNVRMSGALELVLLPGEPSPDRWYDDWYVKLDDA